MTEERKVELYNQAWTRMKNIGAKTELEAIAMLEDEINCYRKKIVNLEEIIKLNKKPVEHDGCVDCKYEDLTEFEEPCLNCKQNFSNGTVIQKFRKDLYVPKRKETVNHPAHYKRENAMECIDEMMEIFGIDAVVWFCLLNVFKYRYRATDKNSIDDLKKSDWYMKKYVELKNRKG